jgi:hypothetical protein
LIVYALLAAMAIGLGLTSLGGIAFIKGPHPHQTPSTSVKIPGIAEMSAGGSLGLVVLGIALFAISVLLWAKVITDVPPVASEPTSSALHDPLSIQAKELGELASVIANDSKSYGRATRRRRR